MKRRCRDCGAGFEPGPASCPLCGADLSDYAAGVTPEPRRDDYQKRVRALRRQLKRIRKDGAA